MSNRANKPRKAAFNEAEVSHSEVHAACFNTLCRSDIPLNIKMAGEPYLPAGSGLKTSASVMFVDVEQKASRLVLVGVASFFASGNGEHKSAAK